MYCNIKTIINYNIKTISNTVKLNVKIVKKFALSVSHNSLGTLKRTPCYFFFFFLLYGPLRPFAASINPLHTSQ